MPLFADGVSNCIENELNGDIDSDSDVVFIKEIGHHPKHSSDIKKESESLTSHASFDGKNT